MEKYVYLGIIAGIFSAISYVPYIVSIIRKKTIPARATWIIWSLLSFTILLSYQTSGASVTIFLPLADAIGSTIVAILSIFYGVGGWTKLDKICLATVALSLVVWWRFDSSFIALLMNIVVGSTGTLPTIKKVYQYPGSEDKTAWSLFFIGSLFNVLAINHWTWGVAFYPISLFILIAMIFFLLFLKKENTKGLLNK